MGVGTLRRHHEARAAAEAKMPKPRPDRVSIEEADEMVRRAIAADRLARPAGGVGDAKKTSALERRIAELEQKLAETEALLAEATKPAGDDGASPADTPASPPEAGGGKKRRNG